MDGKDVRDIGREEADKGEKGAPEFGPVVCYASFCSAEVGEDAQEDAKREAVKGIRSVSEREDMHLRVKVDVESPP